MIAIRLGGGLAALFLSATLASGGSAAGETAWDVPPAGSCQPPAPEGAPFVADVPPFPFNPGDIITADKIEVLRDYIPQLLWENREQFFFEGMRLEVGQCFGDYSPPAFYPEATEKFRGKPKLLAHGGLDGYTAGQPFPPDSISRTDPKAGLKWAWNYEMRYQAAGFEADFRISDIVALTGRAEPFVGHIYKAQMANRSDRADDDYEAKGARSYMWVAGGKMSEPFNARGHAWRQYRDVASQTKPDRTDDLHAYISSARRVRRLSAAYVEGLYMPSFSVGVTVLADMAGMDAGGASENRPDSVTPKRSGWEGLAIRPLRAQWKVLGIQDVLAPINATRPMYPETAERDFGVWGVSFADDRWDLRRAIVLEATYNEPGEEREETARMVLHVDIQTLAPLYYQSWDKRNETIDVGQFVGRWSEDRPDYPRWPDDPKRPIRVIDPAGAAFANVSEQVGWRRESWTASSTPRNDKDERNKISVQGLTKGR